MLSLHDNRWKEFKGGYKTAYDASVPLKRLEKAISREEFNSALEQLYNELHHQGDVGIASYLSVLHIIRIAKEKDFCDFKMFGLITTIEISRHQNNPELPEEFRKDYLAAIQEGIPELVEKILINPWDQPLTAEVLAALAVSKGQVDIARAILLLEDDDIREELLEKY